MKRSYHVTSSTGTPGILTLTGPPPDWTAKPSTDLADSRLSVNGSPVLSTGPGCYIDGAGVNWTATDDDAP